MIGPEDCTASPEEIAVTERPRTAARSQVCLWVVEAQDDLGNWCPLANCVHDVYSNGLLDLETMRNVNPRINFRLKMYVPDDD